MKLTIIALSIFISGITLLYKTKAPHNAIKNAPLESHKYHIIPNLFTPDELQHLQKVAKEITYRLTTRADAFRSIDDSFGSEPIQANGKCKHRLHIPNADKTRCIIPHRIDVARHFFLTGGYSSRKEQYEDLVGRATIFQYYFNSFDGGTEMPEIKRVFDSLEYNKKASEICFGKKILDPMQLSYIINIPGQEVGMHYDTPWFFGADKYVFPPWLLTVMGRSGLYEDIFIRQTQGVSYLHSWDDYEKRKGGFYFYAQGMAGDIVEVNAVTNQALILDGTRCPHGTQSFMPLAKSPGLKKDEDYTVYWNGTIWLMKNSNGQVLKTFEDEEIRISIVWRQRCFDDLEQKEKYVKSHFDQLDRGKIIEELKQDLIKKGKVKTFPERDVEVSEILIKEYIKYPFPNTSSFPYNYCLLDKVVGSWVKPLLNQIC